MDKSRRDEMIAALVIDRWSGFKAGDEAVLEACSDERLEGFRAAADVRRVEEQKTKTLETDLSKANARLTVLAEKLRTAEEAPSEEVWLSNAPPRYKALIDADKAEEDAVRASIVSKLKDLGNNTEAELQAMPIDQLRTLADYARITIPDFSGRGIPKERYASGKKTDSYAPPDPYKDGLERLKNASKMVN